jgi:uncharacterized membrane protein
MVEKKDNKTEVILQCFITIFYLALNSVTWTYLQTEYHTRLLGKKKSSNVCLQRDIFSFLFSCYISFFPTTPSTFSIFSIGNKIIKVA